MSRCITDLSATTLDSFFSSISNVGEILLLTFLLIFTCIAAWLTLQRVLSARLVEVALRDNTVDLYECASLGFVTFEPINAAEGKRLVEV